MEQRRSSVTGQRRSRTSGMRPAPQPERRPPHFVFLVALVAVLGWLVVRAAAPNQEPFTDQEQHLSAQVEIYFTVQAIRAYRDSAGTLPASLQVIGADDEDLTYAVTGSAFALTATVGPASATYIDGEDLTPYTQAYFELAEVTQ